MTINDWLKSKYANELKSNNFILNGIQFKNSYNVSEYCLKDYISTISDDKYYVSNSLPTAGYPMLYQSNESSDYLDRSALSISYPNDSILMNDIFTGSDNILILYNTGDCHYRG